MYIYSYIYIYIYINSSKNRDNIGRMITITVMITVVMIITTMMPTIRITKMVRTINIRIGKIYIQNMTTICRSIFSKQYGHTWGSYCNSQGLVFIQGGLIRVWQIWRPVQHKSFLVRCPACALAGQIPPLVARS